MLHILVVEDNDGLRQAMLDFLTAQGHQVTGLVCAEEVDDTPTQDVPDLYLIHVNLPGENGFILADRILSCHPNAGIVLMTSCGQSNDRLDGYSSVADNYLIKPVEPAELFACLQNLARQVKPSARDESQQLELSSQTLSLTGPSGVVAVTNGECLQLVAFIR